MTMITPSYLGETIEYSSLHACRSTLEDPTRKIKRNARLLASLAALLLCMQWVWIVWLVGPSIWPMKAQLGWQTFVLPPFLGMIWLSSVAGQLAKGLPPFPFGHREEVATYAV